jgi:hypothetical protein
MITPAEIGTIPGPRATNVDDAALINIWNRRKAISQRLRYPYESMWVRNWKAYRAFQEDAPDPQDWWRSNEYIPEIFNSVETILPRMVLGMFSKPEWFDVNCPHANIPGHPGINCFDYERMVKSLLLSGTRRMNLFEPAYEGSKYCTIMGHVWWKLVWEQTPETRMVDVPEMDPMSGMPTGGVRSMAVPYLSYDDPKLSWVSNFRVWPDPTGQGEYFIERIDTTLEKLQRINQRLGIYKNLDTLEKAPVNLMKETNSPVARTDGYSNRENELYAIEGFSPDVRDEGHEGTPIQLDVCVGLVPYDAPDGIQWRRTVIANNQTIIRDGANPTPDLKPEYFSSQQIPVPGFVYGDSVVRYAEPMNRQLNRIANYRMDEVVLGIWQQYIANRNAVTANQLQFSPGGTIFVDTAADVRTAFAVLERRPILPESYKEEAVSMDRIQRTTGATAIQQGSQTSSRETATSVGARVQLGSERFRLAVMWQNMTFKRQLLKRMFALYQRHLDAGRLVRIVGTDYQIPIDITMLQDDVDIDIDADIYDVDGPLKQQALAQLMQAASVPPFAQWLRPEVLLRDSIENALNKDGRKYVKSQAEVAADAQAALFHSVQMAGMGLEPDGSGGNAIATKHLELRAASQKQRSRLAGTAAQG